MQSHFSPGMAAYLELAVEITCLSTMRVKWFFAYHSRHTDSSKIHLKTEYRRGHAFEREGLKTYLWFAAYAHLLIVQLVHMVNSVSSADSDAGSNPALSNFLFRFRSCAILALSSGSFSVLLSLGLIMVVSSMVERMRGAYEYEALQAGFGFDLEHFRVKLSHDISMVTTLAFRFMSDSIHI